MADFITLSCPTCGSKLQITPDLDRFSCLHCGNEHVVRRGGGLVSLTPVVEGLQQIRSGVDRTAAELALIRLPKEIAELEAQAIALDKTPPIQAIPVSVMEGVAAFFFFPSFLMMVFLMIAGQMWWPFLLVIAVVCGTWWLVLKNKRQNTSEALLESSHALLQSELGKLHTQLTQKQRPARPQSSNAPKLTPGILNLAYPVSERLNIDVARYRRIDIDGRATLHRRCTRLSFSARSRRPRNLTWRCDGLRTNDQLRISTR